MLEAMPMNNSMTNNDFKNKFDDLLKPIGFRKKGNYWRFETDELEKIVHLQKSNFSNLYYLNYGFNLKGLNYDGVLIHIGNRLHQSEAFDLENSIGAKDREKLLEAIISKDLIPTLQRVNKETDILTFVKGRPTTNDIPIKVKEYLKIG
jgi:hypothetical protein